MTRSIAASIRRARLSDTAALAELVNRAFAVESWFVDGQRTSADELVPLVAAGSFLVLECAGANGLGAAVMVQTARGDLPPAHGYLGMLSVLPELQGMGLGQRLVRVGEAMAEASGATAMRLRIIHLREELSRWYKRLGYRPIGTAPCTAPLLKRPCHFIEMVKPLVTPQYSDLAAGAA